MEKINLERAFSGITEYWSPVIAGELNGQHVKLARVKGEFVWHHHAEADELFYVVEGQLTMQLRDREILLSQGEFLIVPRGVEHKPVAKDEVLLMLFEPGGTLNTGNISNALTVQKPGYLDHGSVK